MGVSGQARLGEAGDAGEGGQNQAVISGSGRREAHQEILAAVTVAVAHLLA